MVLFSAVCAAIRGVLFNTMSEQIAHDLKYDLFFYIVNKDVAFFDENKTGDLLSRLASDTTVIQDSLGTNISMGLRTLIAIVATIVILLLISSKLTGVLLACILPVVLFGVCAGKKMREITIA